MKETKFKQTDIGLIPEDWVVKNLADVGPIRMCKRIMKYQTNDTGDIPFYKIGTFGKKADAFIAKELYNEFRKKYNYPQKGDILLSAAGTIGRTVVFDGEPAYFQDSNIVWIENKENLVINHLLYYIYHRINWITDTGTIPRIYNGNVRSILFALPLVIEEQKRIANALNQMDDLIAALDEQIEKKKLIKQGAMQQLLTGKTRLKGFTGEWETMKLGNVQIDNGQMLKSSEYISGNVPVIAGGKTPAGFHNKANRKKDTITISGSGAYAGFVAFWEKPIFASDCSTINEQSKFKIRFLYYSLLLQQEEIYKCQAGGAQPHVHAKDIKDIELHIPPALDEQQAIASTLSAMDEEIQTLQEERDKYALVKQGMMQQLLTGKIRLN